MAKKPRNKTRLTHEDVASFPLPGGTSRLFELPGYRECPICGAQTRHWFRQACGDPWCSVSAALEPRFADPTRVRSNQPKYNDPKLRKRLVRDIHKAVKASRQKFMKRRKNPIIPWSGSIAAAELIYTEFDFDEAAWYIDNEWIGKDLRGTEDPRKSSFWSRTSRMVCAFRSIGGYPAVKIRRSPHLSVHRSIVKDLLGTREYSEAFDVFLAWRCGCRENTEVVYKRIEDVPTTDGYHEACPRCGQAPLEILPPKRRLKQISLIK